MKKLTMVPGWLGVLVLVAMSLTSAVGTAVAADKIPLAVVDSQRIVEEYEAARDAREQYQKYGRELELEIVEKEKELQGLVEEIESQKMLLGEDALATKMQAFERKRAEYLEFREGLEQRLEAEYKAKISPILDQIQTIVERIGKEKNYGMIVDSSSMAVLFVDPDYDLTNDVLAALARGDE